MNHVQQIEARDQLDWLRSLGYGDILDAMSDNLSPKGRVYTTKVAKQARMPLPTYLATVKTMRAILDHAIQ